MSSFRLDGNGLQQVLSGKDGGVWMAVLRASNQVKNVAVSKAPVDQGKLRASITTEIRNEGNIPVGIVGTNVEYAIYVHEGTGLYSKRNPRLIRPVNRKALRWPVKNQSGSGRRRYRAGRTEAYTFSKSSRGFPGRPFLRDALKQVLGKA